MSKRRLHWEVPPPKTVGPTFKQDGTILHRRDSKILISHRADEQCDLCIEAEEKAVTAPPISFSYPTHPRRDSSNYRDPEIGPEGTRYEPYSHKLMNSKCMEDALAKSWKK